MTFTVQSLTRLDSLLTDMAFRAVTAALGPFGKGLIPSLAAAVSLVLIAYMVFRILFQGDYLSFPQVVLKLFLGALLFMPVNVRIKEFTVAGPSAVNFYQGINVRASAPVPLLLALPVTIVDSLVTFTVAAADYGVKGTFREAPFLNARQSYLMAASALPDPRLRQDLRSWLDHCFASAAPYLGGGETLDQALSHLPAPPPLRSGDDEQNRYGIPASPGPSTADVNHMSCKDAKDLLQKEMLQKAREQVGMTLPDQLVAAAGLNKEGLAKKQMQMWAEEEVETWEQSTSLLVDKGGGVISLITSALGWVSKIVIHLFGLPLMTAIGGGISFVILLLYPVFAIVTLTTTNYSTVIRYAMFLFWARSWPIYVFLFHVIDSLLGSFSSNMAADIHDPLLSGLQAASTVFNESHSVDIDTLRNIFYIGSLFALKGLPRWSFRITRMLFSGFLDARV
ncbi:MAG: hypothetical protein HYT87_12715 [Nitrospirae bacterium]|nr:hypothetical protein [Nitrospirota bacterium]